jgi:hypothetical protein
MQTAKTAFTHRLFMSLIVACIWVGLVGGQATSNLKLRWTNGIVPYVIDETLKSSRFPFRNAIDDFHRNTCVRFVPRTNQANYIHFVAGSSCDSSVGMQGGRQEVSLGSGYLFPGTIVSELARTLGLFHEYNRSDRDMYLIILWKNILEGQEQRFKKLQPTEEIRYNSFDINSITMGGNYQFSRDRSSMTMEAKTSQRLLEPYQKPGLSPSDILRINMMYHC